jgi:general secretion pathway protein K
MTMRAFLATRAVRLTLPLSRERRARAGAGDAGRAHGAGAHGQRGAAVLMALFVATLATLIVSGLFWSQFVLLRTIENQQLVTQSRLLLRGALDWARAILRDDQRNATDNLDEPWATGLAETRLDQLGETSALAALATMSGAIEDAQGRLNLRNLVRSDFDIDEYERDSLRKLCGLLGLPEAIADLVALHMREALTPRVSDEGKRAGETGRPRPIPLVLPEDLLGVQGIDPAHALKLAPYVVVLDQPTPVNLNTAREEVIAARFPKMALSEAKALVAQRDKTYFLNTGDTRIARYRQNGEPTDTQIAVASRYFIVRGQVKLDRANTRMEALVRRGDSNQLPVRVLWQREL